jgi:energy-coupling factor transporter ATP-binding protein EcfA2
LRLGDLLVAAKLVTHDDIERAMAHQNDFGGRLGDNLVATGAITKVALEQFINRIPAEPADIAATGINPADLLNLLLKLIYTARLESVLQFIDAMKLPPHIVEELVRMAVGRNLLAAMGSVDKAMRYELSEQGKRWAQEALKTSLYAGPAPVPLEDFCNRVHLQKITNDLVTFNSIRAALGDYDVTDQFIKKIGPALNSGRAILLYGPPGNGKTTVALSFANVFNTVIYVPYAVMIEGQIMRVFDPSFHSVLQNNQASQPGIFGSLRREQYDARWIPVRRPFVVTGGELTLEMLDLNYDAATGFYEAPLHIKALGGCFVIDDFGRQIVSPATLLNRWIVPMESRVDYLKLHTGKSFSIPFEALVIFSTNINPEDLMDGAFLRRLPYKIEVGAPSRETYREIFDKTCAKAGVVLTDDVFDGVVEKVTRDKGLELAAFHARFIVDQVIAISRFMGKTPCFDLAAADYALDNLKVRQGDPIRQADASAGRH